MGNSVIPYIWTRGASFSFGLEVRSGSVTGTEGFRAVAKGVGGLSHQPPGDNAPELVVFSSVFAPAEGKTPARWLLSATAAQSLTLPPGYLIADARIDWGNGVISQVAPCFILVRERVTEEA
jgi:hypothetical protein